MESNLQQTRVDLNWLDTPPCVRSTRLRLCIALGVASSIILVALLTVEVNLNIDAVKSAATQDRQLTVDIRRSEPDRSRGIKADERTQALQADDEQLLKESERIAAADSRPREVSEGATEPPVGSVAPTNWNTIKERAARQIIDDHWRKEHLRASLWRQTRSVMFQADGDAGARNEEAPLMANLDFREPAGVLGLGFTIGSCFVGIPLAGIPVEERRTAITLFYCRE
jgi:hypothetical protein